MTTTAVPSTPSSLDPTPAPPLRKPEREYDFGNTLRSEWMKFWSVRGTRWSLVALVVIGVGLTVAVCWGNAEWLASGDADESPGSFVTMGMMLAQIPAMVLGALVISTEYGTGMIRSTFVATPRRGQVLLAKATVLTAILLAAGTITAFAGYLLGNLFLDRAGVGLDLSTPGLVRALIGNGLVLAALGLMTFAVGLLVRHTAAALAIGLGTVTVLANLAWALPGSVGDTIAKSFPGNSTQALTSVVPFNPDLLGPWTGFAVLMVQVVVLLAVGVYTVKRRDA